MQWGTQTEPQARVAYEVKTGNFVDQIAFVDHPTIAGFGCSPDGLVGNDGLIEIKCPISREVDPGAPIPDSYYDQVQLQLVCTGLQECEYVEFKFVKHSYAEWMAATQIKSCFAVSTVNRKVVYKKIADTRTLQEWMMSFMEDRLDWDLVYWSLKSRKDLLIQKDTEWFTEHFPSFQSVWNEIVEYRKSGTIPPPIKSTMILDLDAM
jgi:hypothetical protein